MEYFEGEKGEPYRPPVEYKCCLPCGGMALGAVMLGAVNLAVLVVAAKEGVPADYIAAGAGKSTFDLLSYLLNCPRGDATINTD